VHMVCLTTDPDTEAKIAARLTAQPACAFMGGLCSVGTAAALDGIGPFEDKGFILTPVASNRRWKRSCEAIPV
jgi:hypothetical protein